METSAKMTTQPKPADKRETQPTVEPPVDVYENKEELLVVADLPGVDNNELGIRLENGELTIEGKRAGFPDGRGLVQEFRATDYRRTFLVPEGIDGEKISAELKHGVLRVHLPKSAALKPRQIAIKAG